MYFNRIDEYEIFDLKIFKYVNIWASIGYNDYEKIFLKNAVTDPKENPQIYTNSLYKNNIYLDDFPLCIYNLERGLKIIQNPEKKLTAFNQLDLSLFQKIYRYTKIIKSIRCSTKLFVQSNTFNIFNNTNSITSIDFLGILTDENKNFFKNKNFGNYKHQIFINNFFNKTKNFFYLEPKYNFSISESLIFSFKIIEDNFDLLNIINRNFNDEYDLDFIYSYVVCKFCFGENLSWNFYSNVLEFNLSYLIENKIQESNETIYQNDSQKFPIDNNSSNQSSDVISNQNDNIINSTESNNNFIHNPNSSFSIINSTQPKDNNIISDPNRDTSETNTNQTKNNEGINGGEKQITTLDIYLDINNNSIKNQTSQNQNITIFNTTNLNDTNANSGPQNYQNISFINSTNINNNNTFPLDSNQYNSNNIKDNLTNYTNTISKEDMLNNQTDKNKTNNIINTDDVGILFNNLSMIQKISNGTANTITFSIKNYTSLLDSDTRLEILKSTGNKLEDLKNNQNTSKADLVKETINVNLILKETRCNNNISENNSTCKSIKENTQEKVLKILNETFNCQNFEEILKQNYIIKNEHLLKKENFFHSLYSIYSSSINFDSFSESNINIINDINQCLVRYGPEIIKKIKSNTIHNYTVENTSDIFSFENNFMKILSTTFSNMINIAMNNNYLEISKKNYNQSLVNSLVINQVNKDIKRTIEENAIMFMKMDNEESVYNSKTLKKSNQNFSSDIKFEYNQTKKLVTENLIFYSKSASSLISNLTIPQAKSVNRFRNNLLMNNQIIKTFHNSYDQYESLSFDEYGLNLKIFFPISYLKKEYNKDFARYGIIFYNNYPLLSPNSTNFFKNIFSIKLFDNNLTEIEVKNLKVPIEIFIKKNEKINNLEKCVFYDDNSSNWNITGCQSENLGDYVLCKCNHLTDFSLAKYNPIAIAKDITNLIFNALIINKISVFQKIDFENAHMIYFFICIFIIYLIALISAVKKDRRDENDLYLYEIESDPKACSNEEILKSIKDMKTMLDEDENLRKANALKFLQFKIESSLTVKQEIYINEECKENETQIDVKKKSSIEVKENDRIDNQISFNNDNNSNSLNKKTTLKSFLSKNEIERNSKVSLIKGKSGFFSNFLNNVINNKKSMFSEEINDVNKLYESDNTQMVKDNSKLPKSEIEMQIIPEANEENKGTSDDEEEEENKEENQNISKNENSSPLDIKILEDGLKIQVSDEIINHKEFILGLYNDDNAELKREITKFFSIEKKLINNSLIKKQTFISEQKRDFHNLKNDDIEKGPESSNDKKINSFVNSIQEQDNNISVRKRISKDNDEQLQIDNTLKYKTAEDNSFTSLDLRKNSNEKLFENKDENLIDTNEDSIHIRIKNYKLVRYAKILKHYFVNKYRIFSFIFYTDMPFSKASFLTIIFSRIIATLGVGTMINMSVNFGYDNISKKYEYLNKDLAVSICTIIIIEFIFTIVEGLLKKRKVYRHLPEEQKYLARRVSKRLTIIGYVLLLILNFFFIVNTVWITLLDAGNIDVIYRNIIQLFLSLFLDFFVKEVILLSMIASIIFIVIETEDEPKWKYYLTIILSLVA